MNRIILKLVCCYVGVSISIAVLAQDKVRLIELETHTIDEGKAKQLTVDGLGNRGLDPTEFYVVLVQTSEEVEVQLSHQDDFLPQNRNVVGNPSGKSQVCTYNKLEMALVSCLYYQ
jgi:hypothetical protein